MSQATPMDGVVRALVVEHDAQKHEQIGVAIDDGIEKGAEWALATRQPRQRPVEEVEQAGHGQQHCAHAKAALEERVSRGHAHAETQDGELIRPHAGAQHQSRDRIGDGGERRPVVAQHLARAA